MPNRQATRASLLNPAEALIYAHEGVSQARVETVGVSVTTSRTPAQASVSSLPSIASSILGDGTANSQVAAERVGISALAVARPTLAAPVCDASQSNLYCVYTVQEGDTLGGIAAKFGLEGNRAEGVTPHELLVHSNKPDIVSDKDLLQIGQKVRIPTQDGVIHTVLSAQTLGDIADQYDVSTADILAIAINGINDSNSLIIGQELIVPKPKQFAKPAPPPPPAPPSRPVSGSASAPSGSQTVRGGAASSSGFIWPATGRISSYFSPGHPLGIDIDLYSNPNAPIGSSAAGIVTFAGGNACCSYGYYVVVDHGNGYSTLYAHLSKIVVSAGERVSQGELLGYGGRTGYATGNHLHFEVHRSGVVINPFNVLP